MVIGQLLFSFGLEFYASASCVKLLVFSVVAWSDETSQAFKEIFRGDLVSLAQGVHISFDAGHSRNGVGTLNCVPSWCQGANR